jgi:sugar lactone lactonase YvrE
MSDPANFAVARQKPLNSPSDLVPRPDGSIWFTDPPYGDQGKMIGRIRLPEICANLCFGGPKRHQLLMTASQSVYMLQVNT